MNPKTRGYKGNFGPLVGQNYPFFSFPAPISRFGCPKGHVGRGQGVGSFFKPFFRKAKLQLEGEI